MVHAIAHFHAAGDVAGLTLTLYDLASVAVQSDDLPRAARLRGAAHNLSTETGTGLATFTETAFEEAGLRPSVLQVMSEDEVAAVRRGGRGDDPRRGRRLCPRGSRRGRGRPCCRLIVGTWSDGRRDSIRIATR